MKRGGDLDSGLTRAVVHESEFAERATRAQLQHLCLHSIDSFEDFHLTTVDDVEVVSFLAYTGMGW